MLTLPRHMRVAMDTLSVRTSKLELKKQKRDPWSGMRWVLEGLAMGRLGALRIPVSYIDGSKLVSVPLRLFDISEIGNRPPQRWPGWQLLWNAALI